MTVFSAAANRDGRIFAAVTPFRSVDGAILLEYDAGGELRGRYRLVLPMYPETATTASHRFVIMDIAAVGRTVYATSPGSRRCVYYSIPEL
jgi:KaiC/GvpD/RAD55 family RecA-like ATPase